MAAKKRVRESQEQTVLKFFKPKVRDDEEEEISEENDPNSGDGERDGERDETCSGEEVVQVADLIPANFPEQDLDIGILVKTNMSSVEISSVISSLSPGEKYNMVLYHFCSFSFIYFPQSV